MSFLNKVVIVTGASSGIGAAAAVLFAKEGANVAIVARNQTKLAAVAKQCEAHGQKALIVKADLSKDIDTATIVSRTVDHFGRLDVLVNNAGIVIEGSLLDGKVLDAYDQVMQTNIRAVVQLTMLAAPHLVKTKGNVINISSGAALAVSKVPQMLPYYVSKAAMDHFTRCAALELAAAGVRVNTINPGPVDNQFRVNNSLEASDKVKKAIIDSTALGFIAKNEELAYLILFLASDKAKSVTGSNYVMDNGWLLKN